MAADVSEDRAAGIRAVAERIMTVGESSRRFARDPVNLPIIENWLEAIGDTNPVYTDPAFAAASVHGSLVAPPMMAQVWTMAGHQGRPLASGLNQVREAGDPTGAMVKLLDEAGYTGVVATNSDHVFHRYLRHGERVAVTVSLIGLTGPKRTALGEGWFFTTRQTWYSGDEVVATMDFRILKFRPQQGDPPGSPEKPGRTVKTPAPSDFVMRPVVSPDTAFFWEGTRQGELRIQQCADCGALRHPPGPMCTSCGSPSQKYIVASGAGEIFSYVVHHHPPVPGKELPLVIALVQLDEGVRMLAEIPGFSPERVAIGMAVEADFLRIDDDLVLPVWRAAEPADGPGGLPAVLPAMTVDVSATFVVASALATRDFTPVHHDRDLAVANGSRDIFVNILTDNALLQRFVSQWAGPQALLRRTAVRLGVPCYAGDTLTFTGRVTDRTDVPDGVRYEVQVIGRCSLGDHIIATAVIDVPERKS
jgi:uncharacterized OB-fold protein/acyl dehydratase